VYEELENYHENLVCGPLRTLTYGVRVGRVRSLALGFSSRAESVRLDNDISALRAMLTSTWGEPVQGLTAFPSMPGRYFVDNWRTSGLCAYASYPTPRSLQELREARPRAIIEVDVRIARDCADLQVPILDLDESRIAEERRTK
jgi:hypothetical protein